MQPVDPARRLDHDEPVPADPAVAAHQLAHPAVDRRLPVWSQGDHMISQFCAVQRHPRHQDNYRLAGLRTREQRSETLRTAVRQHFCQQLFVGLSRRADCSRASVIQSVPQQTQTQNKRSTEVTKLAQQSVSDVCVHDLSQTGARVEPVLAAVVVLRTQDVAHHRRCSHCVAVNCVLLQQASACRWSQSRSCTGSHIETAREHRSLHAAERTVRRTQRPQQAETVLDRAADQTMFSGCVSGRRQFADEHGHRRADAGRADRLRVADDCASAVQVCERQPARSGQRGVLLCDDRDAGSLQRRQQVEQVCRDCVFVIDHCKQYFDYFNNARYEF